jgi:hypothetical protein
MCYFGTVRQAPEGTILLAISAHSVLKFSEFLIPVTAGDFATFSTCEHPSGLCGLLRGGYRLLKNDLKYPCIIQAVLLKVISSLQSGWRFSSSPF